MASPHTTQRTPAASTLPAPLNPAVESSTLPAGADARSALYAAWLESEIDPHEALESMLDELLH